MDIKTYKKEQKFKKITRSKDIKKLIDKTKGYLLLCKDLFERMKMDRSGRILEEVNKWGRRQGLSEITKVVRNRDGYCLNEKGEIVLLFSGINWKSWRLRIDPLSDTKLYGVYRVDSLGKEVEIGLPEIDYYALRRLPSTEMIQVINLQGDANFFYYLDLEDFERCAYVNSHWHSAVVKYYAEFYKTVEMEDISMWPIAINLFADQPLHIQFRTVAFNHYSSPPPLPRNRKRLIKYLRFIFGCAWGSDTEIIEGVKLSEKSAHFDLMISCARLAPHYSPILVKFPRSLRFIRNWNSHRFYSFNRKNKVLARRGYPLKEFMPLDWKYVLDTVTGFRDCEMESSDESDSEMESSDESDTDSI